MPITLLISRLRSVLTGAVGDTTPTDSRSRRNRASRRGGQLLTRAAHRVDRPAHTFVLPAPLSRMVAPYAAGSSPTAETLAPATLIPVTNGLERLNGEIKRRTEVVGIFPNDEAIVRLVGAILLEQNDEWAVRRARYMTLETMAALSDDPIVGCPPW
jgi:hypothetical protein